MQLSNVVAHDLRAALTPIFSRYPTPVKAGDNKVRANGATIFQRDPSSIPTCHGY